MPQADYIGYRKIGDLASSGVATTASGARVFATGGADISADIALIASGAAFAANLWDQWTSHPAADARDFIANLKPRLASADPYNRLVQVIAGDQKINERAKDVSARELVLWYRQNYPTDFMTLTPDAKNYFNNYVNSRASQYPQNINGIMTNYLNSKFSTTEINYNATPVQAVSNLFSSATSGTTNWVLYGAIGLGLLILLSKK